MGESAGEGLLLWPLALVTGIKFSVSVQCAVFKKYIYYIRIITNGP